jgi:hypothetical protein
MAQIEPDQSKRWTKRQRLLDAFDRALYGALYRHKVAPFSQEFQDPNNESSQRILLDDRRAAVQSRLPLMLVRDVVGRLWGEAHRPNVVVREDSATAAWVQAFIRDTTFWLTLIEASWAGSSGSTVVVLRVLGKSERVQGDDGGGTKRVPIGSGRFYAEVWPTKECSPVFSREAPGELAKLPRVQLMEADTLRAEGYDVDALEAKWQDKKFGRTVAGRARSFARQTQTSDQWALRVVLDATSETWYEPIPQWVFNADDFTDAEWIKDLDRSFDHGLGETPARWGRPIPFPSSTFPDGMCLFEPVIDFQFRIDRTLSQTGRAFDYAGDPQLSHEPGDGGDGTGAFGGDAADAGLDGGAVGVIDGKAEFVEISGEGLRAAIEAYVMVLRRLAREVGGGSRIDEEKAAGAMSGVAMRLLNASLDVLAGILRITLGEKLFIDTIRLAMRIAQQVDVSLPSLKAIAKQMSTAETPVDVASAPNPDALIDLQWPDAYAPTGQDLLYTVQAIKMAAGNLAKVGPPIISEQTGVNAAASLFGVVDATKELADILVDAQTRAAAEASATEGQAASGTTDTSTPAA